MIEIPNASDYKITAYIEGLHAAGAGEPRAFNEQWEIYVNATPEMQRVMRLAWRMGYDRALMLDGNAVGITMPL